jgi:cytochrome oxidase Cu insertion factor (SCO1/SenC/PrrC family)
MSGMGSVLQITNPTVVAAFRAALLHQGIVALLIFVLLALLWLSVREWIPSSAHGGAAGAAAATPAEPPARRVLRIGFGVLWIFDGILQAQAAMPLGLPSQVIQPAAANSPGWVQQVVNWGVRGWTYHPVDAAAAAVWIQIGIGIWLLTAASGRWSRLGGLASVGWGLVVWVFGEAFGGVFAPGLTWLFGAPGAALFYCVAGALVALPGRAWSGPRLGRLLVAAMGLFLAGMAVLQAWPGRGFWQGTVVQAAGGRKPGGLAAMVAAMGQTAQPRFLESMVSGFGSFTAAHGFAVNLVAVAVPAVIGAALLSGRTRLVRPAIAVLVVVCLADWALVEDFGIFGGLGTDPNSMIPVALVAVGGFLALSSPAAVAETEPAGSPAAGQAGPPGPGWRERLRPGRLGSALRPARLGSALRPGRLGPALGAASPRTIAALGALGVAALGAVPMAAASASTSADPIIAEALDGASAPLDFRAPAFQLTDQQGQPVSLAGLRGKVVLLTFLDPLCTSDCPLMAQEFRQADQLLGASARHVELVAVVANPVYYQRQYTQAFDRQEDLAGLPNWRYLTGTLPQLRQVWQQYSVAAQVTPAGGMIAHDDVAYVIDAAGRTRRELNFNPGPGTASSVSSFANELSTAAQQVMGTS